MENLDYTVLIDLLAQLIAFAKVSTAFFGFFSAVLLVLLFAIGWR